MWEGTQIRNEREQDGIRVGSLSFLRETEAHFFTKFHRDKKRVLFSAHQLDPKLLLQHPDLMMAYSDRLTGKEIKNLQPFCKQPQAAQPTWETASKLREEHILLVYPALSLPVWGCQGDANFCQSACTLGDAETRNWPAKFNSCLSLRNQCQDMKNLPHQMQR